MDWDFIRTLETVFEEWLVDHETPPFPAHLASPSVAPSRGPTRGCHRQDLPSARMVSMQVLGRLSTVSWKHPGEQRRPRQDGKGQQAIGGSMVCPGSRILTSSPVAATLAGWDRRERFVFRQRSTPGDRTPLAEAFAV
jgi:hypothetical protein